jgi:hypothetical protein
MPNKVKTRRGRRPRYMSAADRTAVRRQTDKVKNAQAGLSVLEARIREEQVKLAELLSGGRS